MKIRIPFLVLAFAAIAFAQDARISIDAAKLAPHPIPRTIFGTFLEPIGDSINNGLWAQILENPSFEDNLWSARAIDKRLKEQPALARSSEIGLPLPWEPLFPNQGVRYEPRWRDAANSSRSLLIMALPDGETGVRQRVFLPAHRALKYRGSIYVKLLSGSAELSVSLRRRDHPEEVFAEASLSAGRNAWTKREFALSIPAGVLAHLEPADFVISVMQSSRILIDETVLYPEDAESGLDPDMVKLAREMHTPLVRFGGNYTSGYHWRDGTGLADSRPTMLNQSWGLPEYNQFGTDEFLRFCELIQAEPQIALNLGSGTPEEAADWVKYVNKRWGNHRGGLLWELGNELWGNWQIGYPALSEIGARTRVFSQAVRAADPAARLIGTGADPDHFEPWNAAQLGGAPGAYSYLSTHFVVGPEVLKANPDPEFIADASFALPVGLERRLALMKRQLDADQHAGGKVRIAFTEWLFVGEGGRVPNYTNMGGAVDTAGMLNMLLRNADLVPISDMTGIIWFGGISKKRGQVYGTPAYWAFRMYANADAATLVDTRTEGPTYDVHEGSRRIPEIPNVSYLDVVGALSGGQDKLTLFCVNRRRDKEIRASLILENFAPALLARGSRISANDIYAQNDETKPTAVIPQEISVTVGEPLVFAPASVTVIEIQRR